LHKPKITAIACISENRGIGKDGKLLFSIPADMKFFRETTAGAVVVMGRKTLDSFPGGKPLPGRVNVVLSRNENFSRDGVTVFGNSEKLKNDILSGGFGEKAVFIIGGADIYELFLPITDVLLLTEVKKTVECDSYFPEYGKEFVKTIQSDTYVLGDTEYSFNTYERKGENV
jgi:dihydrofolate reductase